MATEKKEVVYDPAKGIADMPGTALSADELAVLGEGADVPAKRDVAPEPPTPEPAPSPAPTDNPPAPELRLEEPTPEPGTREPERVERETPHSDADRLASELEALPPEELRERIKKLQRESIGQRGAIARINQTKRDREVENESLRLELQRSEDRRLSAERAALAPSDPPTPPVVERGLALERDEEGNYFIPLAQAKALVESLAPKPPPPDPRAAEAARLRNDFETIAAAAPENREAITRLEQARVFLLTGIRQAQQQYGHQLLTVEDTARVIKAYGLDEQVAQHWPGVTFEDVLDMHQGGRLAERVVRHFARAWYPEGVKRNGDLRPELRTGDELPAREPAAPAPKHTGAAPRLPLGDKPDTLHRRGGLRPEPESTMNRLLNATLDELAKKPRHEIEAITGGAIRELEGSSQ